MIGIEVPGPHGLIANPTTLDVSAFADDILAFLRDIDQLVPFRKLLEVYERGAKARIFP